MANIVWSFGIALEAEDRTQEPIDAFADRLKALDKRMKELEESTRTSVDAAASLSKAEEDVGKSVKIVGESVDKTKALFGTFEHTVASAVEGSIVLMGKFASTVFNAPMTLAMGLIGLLQEIPNTISKWVFGKSLVDLAMGFRDASDAAERFLDLGNSFAPIDKAVRQLSVQIGGTRSQANGLLDQIIKIGITSGFSIANVSDLAVALGSAGRSMSSFSEDQVRVLNHLASTFGLGAEETVKFNSAAERMNLNVKELAGTAVVFGQKFQIPGLMQILPGLTNMAAESVSKFSKDVVYDQRQVIESTLKTSAIYAKAFGKDIREAAGMAAATFNGFAAAAQQNSDLMLGLADSMSPLGKVLLQGGANWKSMQNILDQGTKSPIEAAISIKRLMESMRPGPYQDRFKRLLQKELPEGVKQLVFEQKAFDRATRANQLSQSVMTEAVTKGTERFDDMADAMRDNFSTMREVLGNVGTAIKGIFGQLFTDTFTQSIKDATGYISALGLRIGDLVEKARGSEAFEKIQKAVQSISGVLIAAGSAMGLFADGLFSVEAFTGILTPLGTALESLTGLIGKAKGAAVDGGFSFAAFFHGIFKGVGIFTVFGNMLKDVNHIIGDATVKGLDKITNVVGAVFGSFADYFDAFFFSLPSQIVKSFSKGADKEKATFRTALSGIFTTAREFIRDQLREWNDQIPKDLTKTFSDAGRSVGSSLGEIAKTVGNFIGGLFGSENTLNLRENFVAMWESLGAEKGSITATLLEMGGKAIDAVKGFLGEFADGFLGEFGTNLSLVSQQVSLVFEGIALSIRQKFYDIKETIGSVLPIFKAIAVGSIEAFGVVTEAIATVKGVYSTVTNFIEELQVKYLGLKKIFLEAKAIKEGWMTVSGIFNASEEAVEARGAVERLNDEVKWHESRLANRKEEANQTKENQAARMAELDKLSSRTAKYFEQNKVETSKADQAQMNAYENSYNDHVDQLYDETTEFKKNLAEREQAKKNARDKEIADAKGSVAVAASSVAPKQAPTSNGSDFLTNYRKVLDNTSPNYAQIWTMRWEADHFDPGLMPPIPSADDFKGAKGGSAAAPPSLPSSPLSDADATKTPGTPPQLLASRVTPSPVTENQQMGEILATLQELLKGLSDKSDDDQTITVSVDRTGMEFGIKAVLDRLHGRSF